MRRIATYLRARNPDGPSSALVQRAFFEAWFAAHPDDTLVHAFEDLDRDADPPFLRRKGARALVEAMAASEVDAVLVTATDRFGHHPGDGEIARALRMKHGVKLITRHTPESGDGDALWTALSEVTAAYAHMLRSDAARRGAATRRANRLARESAATAATR